MHNKEKYFSILLHLNIGLNGNNGYIHFHIDRFKDIENTKYMDVPTKLDSKISLMLELKPK